MSVATVKKCTITIPQQTGLKTVTYTNNADGTITAAFNVTNIVYETHEGTEPVAARRQQRRPKAPP